MEVPEKRTERDTTYANPDGTLTLEQALAPVRVRHSEGWTPVDLALTARGGRLAPEASPADVSFTAGGQDVAARIGDRGAAVTLGWPGPLPTPRLAGPSALYDLGDGARLRLTATGTGMSSHVLLDRPPAGTTSMSGPTYRLPLTATGLTVLEGPGGSLSFTNPAGDVAFSMAPPVMWDARTDAEGQPANRVPVTSRLTGPADARVLELSPDPGFLTDAATVYPVTVDPAIAANVTRIRDTYVQEGDPNATHNDIFLRAGYGFGGRQRAFMQWETPALAGKHILSSAVQLFQWNTGSCTPTTLNVFRITASWTVGQTWNSPAPAGGPPVDTGATYKASKSFAHGNEGLGCSNDYESIDVTAMATGWINGTIPNYGMSLRAANETDPNAYKAFCAMNYDPAASACYNTTRRPTLSVTYNTVPQAFDFEDRADGYGPSLRPGPSESVGTTTPTLKMRCTDADGDQCRGSFEVFSRAGNGTETLIHSGVGSWVASGGTSTYTVPASAGLGPDAVYGWRASAQDGTDTSAPGPKRYLHTGPVDTTGEERRFSFETRSLTDRMEAKVNVATGNLLLHAVDLTVRGTGVDLVVDRYYNSRSTTPGPLGAGWTLGLGHDVKLATLPDGSVRYTAPSGFTGVFTRTGTTNTSYQHPPGVDATLARDSAADTYTMTFHNGAKYVFEAVTAGSTYRQQAIKDRNGNTITLAYNGAGHLSQVTDTQGRTVTFTYTAGRLSSVDYPDSAPGGTRTNTYTYTTGADALLAEMSVAGRSDSDFAYTGDLLTEVTTPTGAKLDVAFDGSRRATSLTHHDPGSAASETAILGFDYVSASQTKVTDPNGSATTSNGTDGITTYTHDDRNRVTRVVDALGHIRDDAYTSNDNVTSITDSLGATTMGFNRTTDNLESSELATGAKSTLTYGAPSSPHAPDTVTDPEGRKTEYAYDGVGNRTQTKANPAGGAGLVLRQVVYNLSPNNGTVDKVIETHGVTGATTTVTTDYSYDTGNKNLTGIDNPPPLGDVTIVSDASSRTAQVTDGKGQTTVYTYDRLDYIDDIDVAGGTPGDAEVDYDRDADGDLISVVDPSGVTTLTYDKVARSIRTRVHPSGTVDYDYDPTGNLTAMTDTVGTTGYGYDQVNNLTTLDEPGPGGDVTFGYDDNNRRTSVVFPTSPAVTVDLGYDTSGRQKTIKATRDKAGGGTVGGLLDLSYTYEKTAGVDTALRQSKTETGYGTETYGYDQMGRLTTVTGALARTYSYDLASNRTKTVEGSTTTHFDYGKANQLCASGATAPTGAENANGCQPTPAGGTTYIHDGNGNLTSSAGGSNGGWSFSYNTFNQTTAITHGGTLNPLTYAGADQNQRLQAGGTDYVTTALGVTQQTAGSTTVGFVRDNAGNLISRVVDNGGGSWTRHYYLLDGLGSVVGLVDNTGSKVNTYRYDPYGKSLLATETVPQPWRYIGGYLDGTTGLYKLGIRYYDPSLGRFTQRDPTGQDEHYTYAGDNPINSTDASGAAFLSFNVCGYAIVGGCVAISLNEGGEVTGGFTAGWGIGARAIGVTLGSGENAGAVGSSGGGCFYVCAALGRSDGTWSWSGGGSWPIGLEISETETGYFWQFFDLNPGA